MGKTKVSVGGTKVEVTLDIDMNSVRRVVYGMPETVRLIEDATTDIYDRASSMSAGFKSGIRHDPKTRERQGGTPAEYSMKNAEQRRKGGPYAVPVGIVGTGNYASEKDNLQNNTLLKALG